MVVKVPECQPGPHVRVIFFVLEGAKTILCIEERENTSERVEKAPGIAKILFFSALDVAPLLLDKKSSTSAGVECTTKTWTLQESLLTASQFPSRLNASEYIVAY